MTPIQQPGSDLPDNLPLLTQMADEDASDDLPTLTEVVAEEQAETNADRKATTPENETSHARFTLLNPLPMSPPQSSDETTSHSTKPASGRGGERERQSLIPAGEGANVSLREFHINEEEMQRLLRQIETHLENAFTYKLKLNLEKLQRQAIEQAVGELKAELPGLLRDALKAHPEL